MIAPAFTAASASFSRRADEQTPTQTALASVSVSVSDASFAPAGLSKVAALPALDLDVGLITAELGVSLARCRVDSVFCSAFFARVLAHNHPLAFCAAIAFCFRAADGCNKIRLVSSLAFTLGFIELGHFAQAFIVDANETSNDNIHTINEQARYLRNIVEKRTVAVVLVAGERARESYQTPSSAVAAFVNVKNGKANDEPMGPIEFRYAFAAVGSVVARPATKPVLVLAAVEEKDTFPTVRSIASEDASAQPIVVVDAANTSPSSFGTATTSSSGSTESSTDDELATGTDAAAAFSSDAGSEVDDDEDSFEYAAYETAEDDIESKKRDDAEDAFEFGDFETAEEEEVVEVSPEVVPPPAILVEEEKEEALAFIVVAEEPIKSVAVSVDEKAVQHAPTLAIEVAAVIQEVAVVQIKSTRESRHHKAYYCPHVPRKETKPRSVHPSQPFDVGHTSLDVTIVARALDGPVLILTDHDHDRVAVATGSIIVDEAARYGPTVAASTEKVALWLSSVVVEAADKKEKEEPVAIVIPRMEIDEDTEETAVPNVDLNAWRWAAGEEERKEEKKFVRRATSFLQRQKEKVKGAFLLHKRSETLP